MQGLHSCLATPGLWHLNMHMASEPPVVYSGSLLACSVAPVSLGQPVLFLCAAVMPSGLRRGTSPFSMPMLVLCAVYCDMHATQMYAACMHGADAHPLTMLLLSTLGLLSSVCPQHAVPPSMHARTHDACVDSGRRTFSNKSSGSWRSLQDGCGLCSMVDLPATGPCVGAIRTP